MIWKCGLSVGAEVCVLTEIGSVEWTLLQNLQKYFNFHPDVSALHVSSAYPNYWFYSTVNKTVVFLVSLFPRKAIIEWRNCVELMSVCSSSSVSSMRTGHVTICTVSRKALVVWSRAPGTLPFLYLSLVFPHTLHFFFFFFYPRSHYIPLFLSGGRSMGSTL